MANIIEFNEFSSSHQGGPGELYCWLCQKAASPRALFCHCCGTIQPVRMIDHFARLGLERKIDVDAIILEQNYDALRRTLDPSRFAIRGIGERGHAARQLEAMDEAHETLRDPLKRGRYWLLLHAQHVDVAPPAAPLIVELNYELDSAAEPAQCDRVAQRAGQAMELGIIGLLQALRGEDWRLATAALLELDGLEAILSNVRTRRAILAPDGVVSGSVMSVK